MSDPSDNLPDDLAEQLAGALGGGAGGPGGLDLSGMLDQVQALQQQMIEAQQQQEARIITGSSGGGKVTVEVTGGGDFRNVTIAPEVVDPADVEMLEDLLLAAVRDAMSQVHQGQEEAAGGFQLPDLGELGGGLGGLLGGQ